MELKGVRIFFTYNKIRYSVGGKAYETGYIVLPDGTVLQVIEWNDTDGNFKIMKLQVVPNPKGGSVKTIEQRFDAARARSEQMVKTGGIKRHKNPRVRKPRQ